LQRTPKPNVMVLGHNRPAGIEALIHERMTEILEIAKTAISVITGWGWRGSGPRCDAMRCHAIVQTPFGVTDSSMRSGRALSEWTPNSLGGSGRCHHGREREAGRCDRCEGRHNEEMSVACLEIPVEDMESAIAAAGYADRLEICRDLARDGLTPSPEMVEQVRQHVADLCDPPELAVLFQEIATHQSVDNRIWNFPGG